MPVWPSWLGSRPVSGQTRVRILSPAQRRSFQRSKTVLRSAVNRGGARSSRAAGALSAGEAILVMQQPSKLTKASSILVARSDVLMRA